MQFNLSFFVCCLCFFFVISKKPLPNPSHKICVQGFLRDLALTLGSLMHSALIFLYVVEIHSSVWGFQISPCSFFGKKHVPCSNFGNRSPAEQFWPSHLFFYMWIFTCLKTICWKTSLSPMNHLGIPVENQLIMNIRHYLWDLTSLLLICMSVLRLEPHSLEAYSFTVSFEIGKFEFFNFVLFKNCFSYSECCISIRILGSFCYFFPQKSKLRFWQLPHIFCSSAWGVLPSSDF